MSFPVADGHGGNPSSASDVQQHTPSTLNELTDDFLRAHVASVLACLCDPKAPKVPIVAPFVTAAILLRLHNFVVDARQQYQHGGLVIKGWSKQATLARVVGCFTGVNIVRGDADYIGNAQDYYLKDYLRVIKRATKAEREANSRAARSGKDPPSQAAQRVRNLEQQVYRCKFGGVPKNIMTREATGSGRSLLPICKQNVPFKQLWHDADEVNLKLLQEIQTLRHEREERVPLKEMQTNLSLLCSAVEQERHARKIAEQAAAEAEEAHEEAQMRLAARVKELKQHIHEAELQRTHSKAQVDRLGGLLGAAHIEAARALEREAQVRKEAEQAAMEAKASKTHVESRAALHVKELKRKMREAELEHVASKAQVNKLGVLLGAAHVEVAQTLEREAKARKEAEQVATEAAEAQMMQVAKLMKQLQSAKEQLRERDTEYKQSQGRLERLGSQLGAALMEAARATESAREAQTTVEELKGRLLAQEAAAQEKIAHMRSLKAIMAKRARSAVLRASMSDSLQNELDATRKKLREVRRDMNMTKVQLHMQVLDDADDEEVSDDEVADLDSVRELESCDVASECSGVNQKQQLHQEAALALKRLRSMPTWHAIREKGRRGNPKLEWGTRVIIYSLLGMMVPPSAIGRAIVAIVKRTAPWLNPTAPTYETVKRCRFELRIVEEALSARRVAAAFRVRSIGFDETTKFGVASLTSNVQIEPEEGLPLEDVILRAAYCPMGCTSEMVVASIEAKCLSRLRDLLRRWRATFETMFPGDAWSGPNPVLCSLHRLGGGGALISDTCNSARKSRELLSKLIAVQVEEHLGAEAWSTMSDLEQQKAVRTHHVDCWQHIRNIFLAEMSAEQARHVKAELKAELDTFSSWERMSTDFSQLLRASFKEFHHSHRYYKGQGRSYSFWLREVHGAAFTIHLERADGGRQDLDYDAAVPLYINRKYFVEFLHDRVFNKGHANILEDFLYVTFRSVQFVAMARANAIIDFLISRPLRWLSGKSSDLPDWSPRSMGEALDLVEELFMRAQHDGSLLLDADLDLFKPIADKQPLFANWQRHTLENETILAADGKTKHLVWKLARDEMLRPSDATNMLTRAKTVEYLEVQCAAGLRKMHDPRLALHNKLSSQDGVQAIDRSQESHLDMIGVHATNDELAESVFGTYDMILRRCPGISMEAASAVSQSVRSKMLALGDHVARRKARCRPQQDGCVSWFYRLPEREQEALVEFARKSVKEMRDVDRADHRVLDEYHAARRKTNEEDELDALFTHYAYALSFFERWCKRGIESVAQLTAVLNGYGDRNQEKLDWLREQIEMRTVGLSWTDWKTPWSSAADEQVGTVEQLRDHLKEVLVEEKAMEQKGLLPSKVRALASNDDLKAECPAPQLKRKTFKALGTPTVQANALSTDRTDMDPEDIVAAAEQRRAELEARGEIDWVFDRQPYPIGQGPIPDKDLVGKTLEVRWRYRHRVTGQPVYIWCEGEVIQAADGHSDKRTPRCKKVLPAGALRIKWPADVEFDEDESFVWSMLHPKSFNRDVHLGWRFAACELKKMEAEEATRAGKRKPPAKKRKP